VNRKLVIGVAAFAVISVACAKSTVATTSPSATPSAATPPDPATCAQGATLRTPGTLTIGTDNPAYPPYFEGNAPKGSEWQLGYPPNGKGFEAAIAYAVAKEMGFSKSQVTWTVTHFLQSYAPGPKPFDLYLAQVSYKPARAQAADLSDSYYDVTQALVAVKGTPITKATSIADLKQYKLGAPLGTTSADYVTNEIGATLATYQNLSDSVAALNAKQVDGIVVDLPTALYIADPYVQEVKNSTVVGQFPLPAGSTPEHFSFVLPKNDAMTTCVNEALAALKASGEMNTITQTWLSKKTNVGTVPVFSP
jgi:polar amino acid transport system substrate-binding protein